MANYLSEGKTARDPAGDYAKPVEDLVEMFDEAATTSNEARTESLRERQYYNGKQWTATERQKLEDRNQPVVTINRIRRKIDYLRGAEQQNRTDPRAFPRTPDDEAAAEASTDALRYVEEREQLDEKFSDIWENMLIEGYGGLELTIEQGRPKKDHPGEAGELEIRVKAWNWDRLFYDPHSSKHDFSDASYLGGVTWMDKDEVLASWPDKASEITDAFESTSLYETYDDKPRWQRWFEKGKRQRVKVVQIYYRHAGEWCWAIFVRGCILEGGKVPFVDDDGASFCPMLFESAYIDEENNRHGIVRDMMSPQDEINKRRSKLLNIVNVRQTFGTEAAVKDVDEARRELAKPDGHLQIGHGKFGEDFGIIPTTDMSSGQFNLLVEAKAEIDLMGPNAAMQGKGDTEASGRSILAQQQGGMVELTPLLNRLRSIKIRTYRAIWFLVKQYWTAERWIRVTDDEENLRFVGLNKPMTMGEKALKQAEAQGMPPEQIEAMKRAAAADPQSNMPAIDPLTGQPEIENNVTQMDMDIIVEETPDYVSLQHEQFETLAAMGAPFPLLLEMSTIPKKRKLLEKLSQQGPDPKVRELEIRGAEAKIAKDEASATKDQATALKTVGEVVNPPPPPRPNGMAPLQ